MSELRVSMKPLTLFTNRSGGITEPAQLAIYVDEKRVDAAEWFQGATDEHRDNPLIHDELRKNFTAISDADGGYILASANFSHLKEEQMQHLLINLIAALKAAARNEERVQKANQRLAQSLELLPRA